VSLVVREARPADARALVELAQTVGAEPEGWLIANGKWRTVRGERRHLRMAARSRHVAILVAERGGEIVGRLTIARDAHPASVHVADVGLMVAWGARRQGIGHALMDAAEAWARSVGITKIELHVFPYNDAAIGLYEALGYRREGYRSGHFRRGGGLVDAILMAKTL
jgi:putative acetyltransferase